MRFHPRQWLRKWDEFFFKPEAATAIALYRILFGLLVFASGLLLFRQRGIWFMDSGVLTRETLARIQENSRARLDLLLWLPESRLVLDLFFGVFLLAAASLAIGLFTRASALVVFVGLVSLHHRDPLILNSGDTLLRVVSFWMMFSGAGKALSVDRLIRLARGRDASPMHAPWAQRMIQLQLSISYLATALWKTQGHLWRDGTAIYYTSHLREFQRVPVPALFDRLAIVRLMTWGTLFVEYCLGLLIWIPELRYPIVAAGMALHIGIEITMNIPLFQWIMMSTLVTFIDPKDLSKMARKAREAVARRIPPKLVAFYDGECAFCRRSRDVLMALDPLHRVKWTDFRLEQGGELDRARAQKEMLLKAGGVWLGGFEAFRRMAAALPALVGLVPLLHFPGVPFLGRKVYAWVARNRSVLLGGGCDASGPRCRIHS